jgi:hypothetical protein
MIRPAAESFEAETLAVMRKAHELAWARLLATGVVAGHNLRTMQKLTAQHVIELAVRGERDMWRLTRLIIFHACAAAAQERLAARSAP